MNRLTLIVAMGLFATAAFAAPGGGGMRATPTARPADSMTHATAPATRTTNTAAPTAKPTAATANPRTTTRTTGQPNASCEDTPNQPGNSMSAPGSAFNPDGTAGTHYAGEQPQNSKNPNSVSQYDVACARNHSH